MPRANRTTVKSERHADLARRSIEGRRRDAKGRLLARTPVTGDPLPAPPAPPIEPPPDPPSARPRRNPATFRARA